MATEKKRERRVTSKKNQSLHNQNEFVNFGKNGFALIQLTLVRSMTSREKKNEKRKNTRFEEQ